MAMMPGLWIESPGPMMDAAEAALIDKGVAKDRIHIERFTAGRPSAAAAAAMQAAQEEAKGLTMSVTLDGRTRKVEFDGKNILDSAREAGLPAPFACKAGVCATCRAKVVRGKVEMAARLESGRPSVGAVAAAWALALSRGMEEVRGTKGVAAAAARGTRSRTSPSRPSRVLL